MNSLAIKNYALIEDIELSLNDNLTIITGETGAGKSILLGALALLLGKRADLKSLKNPEEKCVIEGVFSVEAYQLKSLFKSHDLDYEKQTIIRREILPSGRSRAFVNDTPVKLQQLSALGENLVDIHSQHETLFIGNLDYQYQMIDTLTGNIDLLDKYRTDFGDYKRLCKELEELKQTQQEARKTYEYHSFLLDELLEAQLKPGMQKDLEESFEQLSNVEELKENLSESLQQIQQEDFGVTDILQGIKNRLTKIENYGEDYHELSKRMQSILIEMEDIAIEVEKLYGQIEDDPEALESVNEKLQNIYKLQKKHNVGSIDELLTVQNELDEKVAALDNAERNTVQLEKQIEAAKNEAIKSADSLTKRRQKITSKLTQQVEKILQKLGMPDAQLQIEILTSGALNNYGNNKMTWEFSANKGSRLKEMKESASGGEFSRITLALKSILTKYSQLPTIIFDEIDTGVSGEIAQKIGDIMASMGQQMQVIAITHLPQIAAKGKYHFKVYKETKNQTTKTNIKLLNDNQKVNELAEMLGGKEKTESAIAHAKSLLGINNF